MLEAVSKQISRAPREPGVYLLKGEAGKILYVGKAKSLRDRLKAYAVPGRDERPSVLLMMPQIRDVEWLLTDNEKEALLLENSLIKEHRPKYNIMLRDDKSYISLKLTAHPFPRLFATRKIVRDGSEYFGPYSSAYDLRVTLKVIQKLFLVRDCSDSFFENRSRPCLQYQIRRCSAPCTAYVTPAQYADQVKQAKLFIAGQRDELLKHLKSEMARASDEQRYEDAGRMRDRIGAIEETLTPQNVDSRADERDADAVGMAGDSEATLIKVLRIRRGRVVGAQEYFIPEPISAAPEILRAFLHQQYLSDSPATDFPPQLLTPQSIPDTPGFEAILSERRGGSVRLRVPRRGAAARLLRLAERNASSLLAERKRKSDRNLQVLSQIQAKFGLPRLPQRIEGYDISNFHGAQPVGSRVVFVDGEADKTLYRHYGIRTVKGSNDFAMLREMFDRRFRKMGATDRPDFILVDGGKGQLRQVVDVLRELRIEDVPVASLAKERELVSRSGRKYAPERIFLPGQKNPVIFPPSSPVLHLLQRVRDEAHRFGITRHRNARTKETIRSLLGRIPGIGAVRQRALLRELKSVGQIAAASVEELRKAKGMTDASARAVFDFFRTQAGSADE